MRVLVKVSGDLVGTDVFNTWLRKIVSGPFIELWTIAGAGTNISQSLDQAEEPYSFGPAGREGLSSNGVGIAYGQLLLAKEKIPVGAKIVPVWPQGSFMLNGDFLAQALYPSFEKVYIVTTPGRTKDFIVQYDRMEIVHLRK